MQFGVPINQVQVKWFGKAASTQCWLWDRLWSHLTSCCERKGPICSGFTVLYCPKTDQLAFQRCLPFPTDDARCLIEADRHAHLCPQLIFAKDSELFPTRNGKMKSCCYLLCSHCLPVNPVLHVHCPVTWSQSAPFWHWHTLAQFFP